MHPGNCPCDGCCNERIGRAHDAYRSSASRVVHDKPTHLIRAWSGKPEDETPFCKEEGPAVFMRRTTGREPFDVAGNPMPLCEACVAVPQ